MGSFNNPANTVNLNVSGQSTSSKCDNCINVPPLGDDGSKNCFEATSIEQVNSGKYVSVRNVAARIARNVKNKNFDTCINKVVSMHKRIYKKFFNDFNW